MTNTDTPLMDTSVTPKQIDLVLTNLQMLEALLRELLQDRDQLPISDVIKEYLTAIQKIERHLSLSANQLSEAANLLTEKMHRLESQRLPEQKPALEDRLARMEENITIILTVLGQPLRGPLPD